MSKNLPNGIGKSLGDQLATNEPLFISGAVWWVNSEDANASDAAGYGVDENKPFATLDYAIGAATAGDTIMLVSGHTESTTLENGAYITVDKRVIIVGDGESGGSPTVVLTGAGSGILMSIEASAVEIRNIKFVSSSLTGDLVDVTGDLCRFFGCEFEGDDGHSGRCVDIDDSLTSFFEECTFTSTATDPSTQPTDGLGIDAGVCWMESVVFDAGDYGWSGAAFITDAAATIVAENVSMLNGAKVQITESGSQVHWSAPTQTGNAQIQEV